MRNQWGPHDLAIGAYSSGLEAKPLAAKGERSLGVEPPATNGFLRFLQKTLVLAHFLNEKEHIGPCSECSHCYSVRQYKNNLVSYMSKSRSLNERRL